MIDQLPDDFNEKEMLSRINQYGKAKYVYWDPDRHRSFIRFEDKMLASTIIQSSKLIRIRTSLFLL